MSSNGMEHSYIKQYLYATLSADPFIQGTVVEGRIADAPELVDRLPSVVFAVGSNQEATIGTAGKRRMVRIPIGVNGMIAGMDEEPLLPVMNRIDVLLEGTRNVLWTANDGAVLNIASIIRDRSFSDVIIVNEDEPIRTMGTDWVFQVAVSLPSGYFD